MSHHTHRVRTLLIILGILVILAGVAYGVYRYTTLSKAFQVEQTTVASLRASIIELQDNLSLSQYERDRLTNVLVATEQEKGVLVEQTDELADTVDNLTKLTTIDPELLKKYSKIYFLNEHYVPSSLTDIDPQYISGTGRTLQFHEQAWPYLREMLEDAATEGLGLRVTSAYRSYGTQANLKAAYKVTYGTTAANRFSAEQGYSEHQLGTTTDLTTAKTGTLTTSFDTTPEFKWLTDNAHKYGFVLSYPKNNKYYVYEPWHWRYVGTSLATTLHDEGKYLYDVDQREIDQYLLNIFD